MSLPAPVKTVRVANLETNHKAAYNQVSATPKTAATVAAAAGVPAAKATEVMSLLVDEGLAVRQQPTPHGGSVDPNTASYTLA